MRHLPLCLVILALAAPAEAFAQFGGGGGGGGPGGGGPGGGGRGPGGRPGARGPGGPPEVGGVTVQVDRNGVRSSIDRRSYSVSEELQTTTGSITDALRNIPSLQVDVEGEVSLRGDAGVTILVDGRPSALFAGEGRGAALMQLPADQIERVEVITNPSAAFSPEGSAGVINLVTRSTYRPGYSGSVRANVGTGGRANGGVNAAYQNGKLTVSGGANARRETGKGETVDARSRFDLAGAPTGSSRQTGSNRNETVIGTGRLALNYEAGDNTRVNGELSYRSIKPEGSSVDTQQQFSPTGALTRELQRLSRNRQTNGSYEISADLTQTFPGDDHELSVDVSREWNSQERERRVTSLNRVPAAVDSFEAFDFASDQIETNVRVDYVRPMPAQATLKAGYALDLDDNTYDNLGRSGINMAALTADPNLTYVYDFKQTIHAGYLTYQQPLGDLTVLGGLRLESTQVDLGLKAPALRAENSYTRAYPSAHLTYQLGERDQLSASYSLRVQRPRADDLNPFRIYQDPFNFRQGNPNLVPQETNSYEVAYQHRRSGGFYEATAYFRQSSGGITDVVRDLGSGVLLTTRENLRQSRSGGLELVANGRLFTRLTYNASTDLAWSEIDAASAGFTAKRDAFTLSGRINLNWQLTANDFLQVNAQARGRRLTAQGYNTGFTSVNLGYRRKLTDTLSGIVSVQDVFDTSRQTQVFDSPTLTGRRESTTNRRGAYIGLIWTFGQRQRGGDREPGFEFGGGGDEGGPE